MHIIHLLAFLVLCPVVTFFTMRWVLVIRRSHIPVSMLLAVPLGVSAYGVPELSEPCFIDYWLHDVRSGDVISWKSSDARRTVSDLLSSQIALVFVDGSPGCAGARRGDEMFLDMKGSRSGDAAVVVLGRTGSAGGRYLVETRFEQLPCLRHALIAPDDLAAFKSASKEYRTSPADEMVDKELSTMRVLAR